MLLDIQGIDTQKRLACSTIASPENPTQRYLFRSRLHGKGGAERLSPKAADPARTSMTPRLTSAMLSRITPASACPHASGWPFCPEHQVI